VRNLVRREQRFKRKHVSPADSSSTVKEPRVSDPFRRESPNRKASQRPGHSRFPRSDERAGGSHDQERRSARSPAKKPSSAWRGGPPRGPRRGPTRPPKGGRGR
jgi:hypothetical protein